MPNISFSMLAYLFSNQRIAWFSLSASLDYLIYHGVSVLNTSLWQILTHASQFLRGLGDCPIPDCQWPAAELSSAFPMLSSVSCILEFHGMLLLALPFIIPHLQIRDTSAHICVSVQLLGDFITFVVQIAY